MQGFSKQCHDMNKNLISMFGFKEHSFNDCLGLSLCIRKEISTVMEDRLVSLGVKV